jgi:hypothetical protein
VISNFLIKRKGHPQTLNFDVDLLRKVFNY